MKKVKRKRANAAQTSSGRPGGPTKKRLNHIADDVMAPELPDHRLINWQID